MDCHSNYDNTTVIRIDPGKVTNGNLYVVELPRGLGERYVFEMRDADVDIPVASGRYYALEQEGKKGTVVQLQALEGGEEGFELVGVNTGTVVSERILRIEEVERMIDEDNLHLLERVDRGTGVGGP